MTPYDIRELINQKWRVIEESNGTFTFHEYSRIKAQIAQLETQLRDLINSK